MQLTTAYGFSGELRANGGSGRLAGGAGTVFTQDSLNKYVNKITQENRRGEKEYQREEISKRRENNNEKKSLTLAFSLRSTIFLIIKYC